MNTVKHLSFILTAVTLLLATGLAQAARDPADPFKGWKGENDTGEFSYDDSGDKPWQEGVTKVPALPADDDLLPVRLDTLPDGLHAYIGAGSLSLDPVDRVLRYWLVIKSPAGAYNASYVGMRCATGELKVYAYGNPHREPPLRPVNNAAWRDISHVTPNNYHREMMRTLLCSEADRPLPLQDILATLRGQRPYRDPSADNIDF